jgi:ABC-2 type transport system ATP-binding protein
VEGLDPHEGLTPIKEKVGYMSQKFTLYQDLKVGENLNFAASLRKIPGDVFEKRVGELFEFIGYDRGKDIMVRDLPGGTRQEISLVTALLHDPDIVFLDEPTSGVTPASRARFWDLIRQITGRGKTVFVTTHYMQEAEQCGRIALMRDGRIVALDTPEELKKNSFPEPLYELIPAAGPTEWVGELEKSGALFSLKPYGLRYHAVVKNEKSWLEETKRHSGKFEAKRIPPSLEDVFIRVVEGEGS